jgi:hypothetical protein
VSIVNLKQDEIILNFRVLHSDAREQKFHLKQQKEHFSLEHNTKAIAGAYFTSVTNWFS